MPTLPNMGLITPTAGADRGTWDDKINAAFALVDAHDHTTGKGVAIVSAALSINADVAWGGYGITGFGKLSFTAITAPVSGSKNLFVNSADNELYWRSNGGTNVKLTNGSTINTSLIGGIAGDYSTVGAEVAFSDADNVYTFKDQSSPSKKWARLASGPVRIYEYDTTESVYVEHAVAAALAAPYTITWPAAVPASQAFVQISAAGVVTFSNTIDIGDGTITMSGAGRLITGDRRYTCVVHGNLCHANGAGVSTNSGAPGAVQAASVTAYYPITVTEAQNDSGGTIKLVSVIVRTDSASANNTTYSVVSQSGYETATFSADIAGTATTSTADTVTLTLTTPALIDGLPHWVKVVTDAGSTRTILTLSPTLRFT